MSVWRAGRSVGRTLYVDGRLVGLVDTPELAAEIVETMNRVGRLLDEVRPVERQRREAAENARERSRECIHCDSPARPGSPSCGECPDSQDAQRRSEATPKNDLQRRAEEAKPEADASRWPPSENCYCGPPDFSLYAHRIGTGPHCRNQDPQ